MEKIFKAGSARESYNSSAGYKLVSNGMDKNMEYTNAHLFYKGKSVIVDYEWTLHPYGVQRTIDEKIVPFEICPYDGDIAVGCAKLDPRSNKVDLENLIQEIENILAVEGK